MSPTVAAFKGGDNKNGNPKTLPPPGGKIQETKAPINAVKAPSSGPNKIPKTDAINAVKLIVSSGSPIAGTYKERIERA